MRVILASNNQGKIKEFSQLLKNLHIEITPQAELGVKDVAETGLTFIENALIKARYASRITNLPAIADDSGLVVDALSGAPGIYSARYAGVKASSQENIDKLLTEMNHIPDEKRQASFYAVLVYLSHAEDPMPLIAMGKWSGVITHQPKGEHGFGYDPIFYVPTEKKTAAELPLEIKNRISHRSLALQQLLKMLPEKL